MAENISVMEHKHNMLTKNTLKFFTTFNTIPVLYRSYSEEIQQIAKTYLPSVQY
jgi:hypothetical protein